MRQDGTFNFFSATYDAYENIPEYRLKIYGANTEPI